MADVTPFTFLNEINFGKNDLLSDDPSLEKAYNPFMINRGLSQHSDTVLLANEINMNGHIPNKLQFDYFLNSVRRRKRFGKWPKKEKEEYLELVKKVYGYSESKARQALALIPEEQLRELQDMHTQV